MGKKERCTNSLVLIVNPVVSDGRIYVIGGDFGPPEADVEEYDPAIDTWRKKGDMPTPRGTEGETPSVYSPRISVLVFGS